jgi:DNA uptake protein ComE-like DNA-binding protein
MIRTVITVLALAFAAGLPARANTPSTDTDASQETRAVKAVKANGFKTIEPKPAATAPVDANLASRADLETIKGIGPALAGKILAARQSGSFKDWADLVDRVAGVGPGSAARLSSAGLTVAGAAYTTVAR